MSSFILFHTLISRQKERTSWRKIFSPSCHLSRFKLISRSFFHVNRLFYHLLLVVYPSRKKVQIINISSHVAEGRNSKLGMECLSLLAFSVLKISRLFFSDIKVYLFSSLSSFITSDDPNFYRFICSQGGFKSYVFIFLYREDTKP